MTRISIVARVFVCAFFAISVYLLLSQQSAHAGITIENTFPDYNGSNPWVIGHPLYVGRLALTGRLLITNGSTLALPSDSIVLGAGSEYDFNTGIRHWSNGSVLVGGIGSSLSSGSDIQVGAGPGTGNTLSVINGAILFSRFGYVGTAFQPGRRGNGTASVVGNGSRWNSGSRLGVGHDGTGSLVISDGGVAFSDEGYVGLTAESTGSVMITGFGSGWHVGNAFTVGVDGSGTVTLQDAGLLNVIALSIGPRGVVNLNGGRVRFDSYSREGVLNFQAGTVQLAGHRIIGADAAIADIFGSAPVVGAGKELSVEGNATIATNLLVDFGNLRTQFDLTVGDSGSGRLRVINAGYVASRDGYVETSVTNRITGGSSWYVEDRLRVGNYANGALLIEDGSLVSSALGAIGQWAGSEALVNVSGAGSSWTNTTSLTVGYQGEGRLSITNGGAVVSDSGFVAATTSSHGSVTVSGADSTWTNNSLVVGFGGPGTLRVVQGGAVSAQRTDIGALGNRSSRVTVEGDGSTLNSPTLALRAGDLIVSNGGRVYGTSAVIRGLLGFRNTVSLSGAGSRWEVTDYLTIGDNEGVGEVAVGEGGTLVTNRLQLWDGSQLNLDGGTLDAFELDVRGTLTLRRSAATTVISGNYTQSAAGRLDVHIDSAPPPGDPEPRKYLSILGNITLGGELSVSLTDEFMPLLGHSFDILDWGSLSGTFSMVTLPSLAAGLSWDASQLYATGIISVVASQTVTADFDNDGVIDGDDLTHWQNNFGVSGLSDSDGDGDSDGADFLTWQRQLGSDTAVSSAGAIPEPSSLIPAGMAVAAISVLRGRSQKRCQSE